MHEMQKKLTWSSLRSGIVITLAVLFLFITIFFSGNISAVLSPKSTLFARIQNIQGLRTGAPVWLYGYEVGIVKEIKLDKDGAVVKMAINQKNFSALSKNSVAMIMTMGILGDKYIEINPGTHTGVPVAFEDTISGMSATGFEQIIASTRTVMLTLDSTLMLLGAVLTTLKDSGGTLHKLASDPGLYDNLNASAGALSRLTNRFYSKKGSLSMLVEDSSLYTNLNDIAVGISNLLEDMRNGSGDNKGSLAGVLLKDQQLAEDVRQTVLSLKSAADQIDKLIADLRKNPGKYFNIKLF